MKKTTLLMKGRWHAVLLVLLLNAVGMGKGYAQVITTIGGIKYLTELNGMEITAMVISVEYAATVLDIPSSITYQGYTIPVTGIGYNAFRDYCSNSLVSVTIPNSVTYIHIGAVYGDFDGGAFGWCHSLENIHVESGNPVYSSVDGILYDASKETILKCPLGKSNYNCIIPNTVSSLECGAFADCNGLVSVTIPNTVVSIGSYAFRGCVGLTSVVIPNTVSSIEPRTFADCNGLVSVTIPNTVTSIGENSFYGCSNLTSMVIPNSVSVIGYGAFENCVGLTSITIPNSVTSILSGAFMNCTGLTSITIPNSVTMIHDATFSGCNSLVSIDIPNSVTYIGMGSFSVCSSLTSITIPASVDTIRDKAFENCSNIREVNFDADNCTYMGSKNNPVFSCCTSLGTLHIGEQVQTIPDYAFYGCSGLTGGLIIPDSVTAIGREAFNGCSGITSLTIGNSVASIGYDAFKGCNNIASLDYDATNCADYVVYFSYDVMFDCSSLTTLKIGENVQTIPANAFKGCNKVTNLIIPNSVTSIGSNAFSNFNGTFITIPKSVASIGSNAFRNCARLTTVYYNAENATGSSAFSNCANLTTIHIGADVHEIHPVFSGCSSVHLVVALGPTPAVLESNALTDIAQNSILMVSCGKRLTYFSVWNMFEFNNIMEDCSTYPVSMSNVGAGGSIAASNTNAQMGEVVELTVSPNAGMVLSTISVVNASDPTQTIPVMPVGKATSNYRFVMPPFGVSVVATFEHGDAYAVNISSSVTGGSITASTTEALAGETVTLTVIPNPGYELRSLTVCNANDASQTVNVTNNTFIMPSFDVVVSAIFEHGATYSIGISSNIAGGSVTASTLEAMAGETVTLDVRPDSGYELRSLSVYNAADASQTVSVTNNAFIMPSFDVMISAIFNYTSVDENGSILVSIHPNPTSGQVRIEAENLKHITISNMLGQRIYESKANGNEFAYNFGKHGAGIYLVHIETANGVAVKKVSVTQ